MGISGQAVRDCHSKILARLSNCQVLAVYMERGLDRIALPCDPDDLTFYGIKQHLPIFLPLLKSVEIFL